MKRSPGPPPEKPVECDDACHAAIKALHTGTASAAQQQWALGWIVHEAAGTHNLSFRPGENGALDTAFGEGRRFVGLQILKQVNTFRIPKSQ